MELTDILYLVFDASSKLQSGLLVGNSVELGNFDECISIEHHFEKDNMKEKILGKYCGYSVTVLIPGSTKTSTKSQNVTLREEQESVPIIISSICLPDACSPTDLAPLASKFGLDGVVVFSDNLCQTKELNNKIDGYDIFAM